MWKLCKNNDYNINVELHIADYANIKTKTKARAKVLLSCFPSTIFDQNATEKDDDIMKQLKLSCDHFEHKYIDNSTLCIYYDKITSKFVILNLKNESFAMNDCVIYNNITDTIIEYIDDGAILFDTRQYKDIKAPIQKQRKKTFYDAPDMIDDIESPKTTRNQYDLPQKIDSNNTCASFGEGTTHNICKTQERHTLDKKENGKIIGNCGDFLEFCEYIYCMYIWLCLSNI